MFNIFKKKEKVKLIEGKIYYLGDRYIKLLSIYSDGRIKFHIITIKLQGYEIIGGNGTEELLSGIEYINDINEYEFIDNTHKYITGKPSFKKYQTKSKYYHLIVPDNEYSKS